MHNAPSVRYPAGRSVFYARCLLGLGALGLLALVGGWWMSGNPAAAGRVPLIGVLLWLFWIAFATWSWKRTPDGLLHWDALADSMAGQSLGAWVWHSEACRDSVTLLRVDVALDLQHHMLLRLHRPDASAGWVWVERARDPLRWNEIRRALTAHRQQGQAHQ